MEDITAFSAALREKLGENFTDVCIVRAGIPDKHWFPLITAECHPVIVLGLEEESIVNCCCLEQPDIDKALQYLGHGKQPRGQEVYLALYERYYQVYGHKGISISQYAKDLIKHTVKYDVDYRLKEDNKIGDKEYSQIMKEIYEHLPHIAAYYLENDNIQAAKNLIQAKDDDLRHLYYQGIERDKQNNELTPQEKFTQASLTFEDGGSDIIAVVDDIFALAPEQYHEFQDNLKRCFSGYQVAWIKDGCDTLDFLEKYRQRIVLFVLDMCFTDAQIFVDSQGEIIKRDQADFVFIRSQGSHLAEALRKYDYNKGIIVFSDKGGEYLAHHLSNENTKFLTKQDFFHRPLNRNRLLESLGIQLDLSARLQGLVWEKYGSSVKDSAIAETLVNYLNQHHYNPGRRINQILQGILEEFPDAPCTKTELDYLLQQDFIENFAEDNNYYDWYEEQIKKQFGLKVCHLDYESWPLLLLRDSDKKYYIAIIENNLVEQNNGSQCMIFDSNDSPFCLLSYWITKYPLEENLVKKISNREYRLLNVFHDVQSRADRPGDNWNFLQELEKKLSDDLWNPEVTFNRDDSPLTFAKLAASLYRCRKKANSTIDREKILHSLFYFNDSPMSFYAAIDMAKPMKSPSLSRYFRTIQTGEFMNEFERRCFWQMANALDGVLKIKASQYLDKIEPDKFILAANAEIGTYRREIDILIATPYCHFFIELKNYPVVATDESALATTLYDVVNSYRRQYNQTMDKMLRCYRLLISDKNNLTPPSNLHYGDMLHGNIKQIDAMLKLIIDKIVYDNFKDQQYISKFKSESKKSINFINSLVQEQKKVRSQKNLSQLISIDRYFLHAPQYKKRHISKLLQELKKMEQWNNCQGFLVPQKLSFIDRMKQPASERSPHAISYFQMTPLFSKFVHWEKFRWTIPDRIKLAKDFFSRMNSGDNQYLQVNNLAKQNIKIIDSGNSYKIYLQLDGVNLRYVPEKVSKTRSIGYNFSRLLELLDINVEDFFHYYDR